MSHISECEATSGTYTQRVRWSFLTVAELWCLCVGSEPDTHAS